MQRLTLAFDIYGTLIDTDGVVVALRDHVGDDAGTFAGIWRQKQLEYSFRRGLMQRYRAFPVCTRQALDYTCERLRRNLSQRVRDNLMARYRTLPVFTDVVPALQYLHRAGCRMFGFSNGLRDDVEHLLDHAGVGQFFHGIVSVDDVRTFKPHPDVYAHFLKSASSEAHATWLISSNAFDVLGARSARWPAVWVRRDPGSVYDPWDLQPSAVIETVTELHGILAKDAT